MKEILFYCILLASAVASGQTISTVQADNGRNFNNGRQLDAAYSEAVMAFAEDEKNELRLIFHESMEPIRDLVNKHHQTLYGANEENGLRSEVRSMKKCQSDIETEIVVFKRSVKWIATAVSGAIGTGATILTSFFKQ